MKGKKLIITRLGHSTAHFGDTRGIALDLALDTYDFWAFVALTIGMDE